MKKIFVLLGITALVLASDFVPMDKITAVADQLVQQKFGLDYHRAETVTYYYVDGLPSAYALVYKDNNGQPLTIVMGARYTTSPVGEISHLLPRSTTHFDKIVKAAVQIFNGQPEITKRYYWGPCEEYVGFAYQGKEILINAYSLKQFDKKIGKIEPDIELENLTRQKWEKYFTTTDFRTRHDGYVDSVPFIDWVYGCSPCAASMMLYYWDSRGYGRLVDYFFTHWDEPEGEVNECANVNRELAIGFHTDTLSGASFPSNFVHGMNEVCNTNHGYSFTSTLSPQGNQSNQYQFSWIKTEIDNQRPCHWSMLQYWMNNDFIGHSVTGVGYEYILPDTFIIIHSTWSMDEPLWPLWTYYNGTRSYDYVMRSIPGGANANNIQLDRPLGGDVMTIPSIFAGLKYNVLWHTAGSIDHVKMWWSRGQDRNSFDSTYWTLISDNLPNNGKYVWTCPATVCSLRINISGLNSSNVRQAADGAYYRTLVRDPSHTPEIILSGHYDTEGSANEIVLNGSYAYIADGTRGLTVLSMADSTLPEFCANLSLPGNSNSVAVSGQYLYISDKEDTFRVISIASPTNPVQVGKCSFSDDALDIAVMGNYAYVAARGQGLVVVNIANPSNPVIAGTYDSPGFAQDVVVDGNYAYLADATQGIRVVDISNPANPVETGYNNTSGIAYGVTKSGNYVYAADGNAGIKVFDATSPDTLIQLGMLDTPTQAQKVQYTSGYLFVADGVAGGLRAVNVTNPSTPTDAGNLQGYGNGGNLAIRGRMIYVADGNIGMLSVFQTLYGIEEQNSQIPFTAKLETVPSVASADRAIHFILTATGDSETELNLIDCSGRRISSIYRGPVRMGENRINWTPGDGLAAGIYFVEHSTGGIKDISKLVLLR